MLLSGEPAVGAAHSLAVQLGAGKSHHVSHSDGPLHGARLALPLRLPRSGQCYPCPQGQAAGKHHCTSLHSTFAPPRSHLTFPLPPRGISHVHPGHHC